MLENAHVSLSNTNFFAYSDISLPNLLFIGLTLLLQQKKRSLSMSPYCISFVSCVARETSFKLSRTVRSAYVKGMLIPYSNRLGHMCGKADKSRDHVEICCKQMV
jgi:hypothetical protein